MRSEKEKRKDRKCDNLEDEIEYLDRTAHTIVKSFVRHKYSFASMLFFASRVQWFIFNVELIRNELKLEGEALNEMMRDRINAVNKKDAIEMNIWWFK
jgi:hypothetical protein